MKIRCTWHEALHINAGGRMVTVNPGDVVEVGDECADLLVQNGGTKFAAVTPPKKKAD